MASEWTKKQVNTFLGGFDDIDTEKNGTLRFKEVVEALKNAGYRGGYFDTKKLFTELDCDDDKVISRDEYKKAFEKIPVGQQKGMALRTQFTKMDANKNGSLTRDEICDALKITDLQMDSDKVSNLLIGLVKDKDGKLNYEEFLALYEKS